MQSQPQKNINMTLSFDSHERQEFSLCKGIQTGSGTHSGSIQWLQGALSRWVMQPECKANHTHQSCAMVKNECSCISTAPHAFAMCTGTTVTF
jgi:hypothetical protein